MAANYGSYQFLVLDNATQPQAAIDFGLDPNLVWDGYNFADAAANTATYVEEVMNALGAAADDRFQTE
jgi:iron(III) transport system substrate-binding protein